MTPTDPRPPGPRDWRCDLAIDGEEIHVRPRNDHIWHTLTDDCPCGPAAIVPTTPGPIRWIHIHYALDGRTAAAPDGGFALTPHPCDDDEPGDDGDLYKVAAA